MAKLTMPLGSYDARGKVAGVVYSSWRGVNYARRLVVPMNPQSDDQTAIRDLITAASQAWKNNDTIAPTTIDAAYKLAYFNAAAGQAFSGFNLYIKDCVGKNGGIAYTAPLVLPTAPGDNS